ncbi:MAG TPA: hypothetical protein PKH54_02910, partial [Myxococcota bacterium]|nr:hypothetical protein [Myxococcota bacterium]
MRGFPKFAVSTFVAGLVISQCAFAASEPDAFDVVVNEGKKLSSQGRYVDAALVFERVLSQGNESQAAYQEAQYEMGVALFLLGLPVAAFTYFDRVGEVGESHVRYIETLPWLVKVHQTLPGETSSLLRMASYPPAAYPPESADEISFN